MIQGKITKPTKRKPDLREVLNRFETWRSMRKLREPIPDDLWEAAASLHQDYSIHQISKTLHLNHTDLKRHIRQPTSEAHPHSAFVELELRSPISQGKYMVEIEEPGGAKMRVHVHGAEDFDLSELTKAFLGRRP